MRDDPYGSAWVYESIVGAIPGVALSDRAAVLVQFAAFEGLLLALAAAYGLPGAVVPGTAAVAVAAAGSAFMLDIGRRARGLAVPDTYRRLLFSSSVEVVLGVLAYAALVTYLFVHDPRTGDTLLVALLGPRPPLAAVFLLLLVCWDVCYRIGTGWWAAVVSAYAALRYDLDADARSDLHAVGSRTAGFAAVQLLLVPFVAAHPALLFAVAGHVAAVWCAVALALGAARTSSTESV